MTQTAGRTAWYVERFDEFVRSLNGSSSAQLLALRKEAMDAFVGTGLPHGARRRVALHELSHPAAPRFWRCGEAR